MIRISRLNILHLFFTFIIWVSLIWNFFKLVFSNFYIFFMYVLNNFRLDIFYFFKWFFFYFLFFCYLFFLFQILFFKLLYFFFKLKNDKFGVLKKYSLFFNFYELKIYGHVRLPVFVFRGFNFWYNKVEKWELFLVENYGNVSSIKYNLYDYPLKRLKFLDYRIKLLFEKVDKLSFEPILLKINKSIPPFSFDLNFFSYTRSPTFIANMFWPSWLLHYYWPFNFLELYLIIFINFFLYYKFYINYFNHGSIFFLKFSFIRSFLLYFYYFLYKFFSFLKLVNFMIFNLLQILVQKFFVFLFLKFFFFFKRGTSYFIFYILYFLKTYLLLFFFYFKCVFMYIYDNIRLCIEFFIPKVLLSLQWIDYNFYLVVFWNFLKSKVISIKKHFWNFFNW